MYFHHLQLFLKKIENDANNFKKWYNCLKFQWRVNIKSIYIYKIKLIEENAQFLKIISKQIFCFTYFIKLFLLTQPNMFY